MKISKQVESYLIKPRGRHRRPYVMPRLTLGKKSLTPAGFIAGQTVEIDSKPGLIKIIISKVPE